jgi:phenylalanyl-tRNA synthetase beta chain
MRLPLSWVREYLDLPESPGDIADRLNLTGTAVEVILRDAPGLENVVVGKIVSVAKHPNADRLTYDEVDVGTHIARIVCGAPNVMPGMVVPVALLGATLPNGMTIEGRSVRGVVSEGMMCAPDEIGLGDDHAGIMELDAGLAPGTTLSEALGLGEPVLELEVTPNRPDCLSIRGLAREMGAVFGRKVRYPTYAAPGELPPVEGLVKVAIEDPLGCPRYVAMVIEGISIGPSPQWMQDRLRQMGSRPINNIVDITNYVMYELGQPLHAFDYDKVVNGHIIVRRAREREDLETLDGVRRKLTDDMLVICDPSGPVALAGVMGGASTEVGSDTTRILLESANFDPPMIMRTSRGLGLLSESSARFEKGVDLNGALEAARRAASLMAELGSGTVRRGAVDVYPAKIEPRPLMLRPERANAILGTSLGIKTMADSLTRLELEVSLARDPALGSVLSVAVPTFRPDLEREVDLIEEVARLVGFSEIPSTLPRGSGHAGGLSRPQRLKRSIREILEAAGLSEGLSMGFADEDQLARMRWPWPKEAPGPVSLVNPVSVEQGVLRPTILSDMASAVRRNQSMGEREIALYEIGRVWPGTLRDGIPLEEERVTCVLSGSWQPRQWHAAVEPFDMYDLIGVLEEIRDGLALAGFSLTPSSHPAFMPGHTLSVGCGGRAAGIAGQLHPAIAAALDVEGPVFLAELDLAAVIEAATDVGSFQELPRFPASDRDLAVVVDDALSVGSLVESARAAGGSLLADVRVFDVYMGAGIEPGKKSVGLTMSYRASERTLTDEEVDAANAGVERALIEAYGAVRR